MAKPIKPRRALLAFLLDSDIWQMVLAFALLFISVAGLTWVFTHLN